MTPNLQPQNRDLGLLRGLFESRGMTTAHAAALYFDGSRDAAKKRLQKLKTARLIGERKRLVSEPSVLFLTREGLELLQSKGVLADYPQLGTVSLQKRSQVSDITMCH